MLPLRDCPSEHLRALRGVLADIDDTITSDGRLRAEAYAAMEQLHDAGLIVVPITGRPAGWCDHIARMWPVDAVVGENGAFWFRYDHDARLMSRRYVKSEEERETDRRRMHEIAREILTRVPAARVSADQRYREADLAIDFCEDVARLTDTQIDLIVAIMTSHAMTVKVSSIHVNGWFGEYDKLTTTIALLEDRFATVPGNAAHEFGYIGDSPNDAPMFGHFHCTVGVANVLDFAQRIPTLPRFVTEQRSGLGFSEFARAILHARRA